MLKSKVKFITITFLVFVISFNIVQNNYGKSLNDEVTNWRIVITSDTKELKDTRKIKFNVEDNPNVVKGKIAPGLKAEANIEIDFTDYVGMADIQLSIDDTSLFEGFNLIVKLNGEKYNLDSIKTISLNENNQIQNVVLELEWAGSKDAQDTYIGNNISEIRIPIEINVIQHV